MRRHPDERFNCKEEAHTGQTSSSVQPIYPTPLYPSQALLHYGEKGQHLLLCLHLTPSQTGGPGPAGVEGKFRGLGPGQAAFLGKALVPQEVLDWQLVGRSSRTWMDWMYGSSHFSPAQLFSGFSFFIDKNLISCINGVWIMPPGKNVLEY